MVARRARGRAPGGLATADEATLAEAVRRLVETLQPERIYLFGSRARGDSDRDSDYDFLVVVQDDADRGLRELERAAYQALEGLGVSRDVLVSSSHQFKRYQPVAASLAATVTREGRLLYGETERFEEVLSPMDLEERRAELVRDWLSRAEQDLLTADRAAAPPPLVNGVAFHAQQAAEKALKAFLTWHDRPFRKTHELPRLLQQCEQVAPEFASLLAAAKTLSPYAEAGRYPGSRVAPTERDAEEARHLARQIVEFVKDHLPPIRP